MYDYMLVINLLMFIGRDKKMTVEDTDFQLFSGMNLVGFPD